MKPDAIKRQVEAVSGAVAGLNSFGMLMLDGRHNQTEMQEVGQLVCVMAEAIQARLEVLQEVFAKDVLPFYKDFEQAREAMRASA